MTDNKTDKRVQYRVVIPVLGLTLLLAGALEALSRALSITGAAEPSTCKFLTFLSMSLICWALLFLVRTVSTRSTITFMMGIGTSLIMISQLVWLGDVLVGPYVPLIRRTYQVLAEITITSGIMTSVFGLLLAVIEHDKTRQRFQRDREKLRREIEERQRVEQALRQNEVKYRSLVDGFPHAAIIVSKGRIAFANPMAAAMLRQESPQILVGTDPMQFVVPRDQERVTAFMRGRFSVGREAPETYELTLLRTNGKTFPAMVTVGIIPFMESIAFQIVVVDLSEQKKSEQALRESENRLRMVLEATSDGYWDFDVASESTYYSSSWAALLGYKPEEVGKETVWWLERVHPEDRYRALTEFQRHATGQTPRYEVEYRLFTKDGKTIWTLSRGRVVERDEDGTPKRIVGTHTDVSRRKEAEEALRQAYAAVELRVQERTASLQEANTRLKEEIAERKRTEQSLRESQTQLAEAQRIGRMGNWVQDLVTMELTWSEEIYRIFEIRREDFASDQQAFLACVHPGDRDAILELTERVSRGEAQYDIEHRIIVPNGTEKVVHEHAELVRGPDGTSLRLVGTVQDVTERKLAERAMENRLAIEQLVSSISTRFIHVALDQVDAEIDQAMQAIGEFLHADRTRVLLFSPDQRFITRGYEWFSQSTKPSLPLLVGTALEPYGWSMQYLENLEVIFVTSGEALPAPAEAERRLWLDLEMHSVVAIPMAVGKTLLGAFTLESNSCVKWAQEDLPLLQVLSEILTSVVARTRAELAIRQSEEKYRSLLEGLSEAVFKYSLEEQQFEYLGPATKEVFGYAADDFLADSSLFEQILHPECRHIMDELTTRDIPPMVEYRVLGPQGEVRWIIQSNTLVHNSLGEPIAVEGLARNVTQRRQAEYVIEEHRTRLIETSKMSALGEMAASIAHEINNPLNIISGSAEQLQRVLQTPNMGPEIAARLAEGIMRHVFRIKKIIQGMRSFTRDSSQDPFQKCALKTIIEDAVILCQDRFSSHDVRLTVAEVPDDLVVECRPTQIVEVLVNLLSNALHAVEDAEIKNVEVRPESEQDYVVICVTDTGPGISPDIAGKVFEPLITTKIQGKGTGLGLSISKRIVESHRGSIRFGRSEDRTWFRVELPRCQGAAPTRRPQSMN